MSSDGAILDLSGTLAEVDYPVETPRYLRRTIDIEPAGEITHNSVITLSEGRLWKIKPQ